MAERVLITGGAGFIGTRLTRHLLDLGFEVRILDNLHPQVHGQDAAVAPWMRAACDVRVADVRDRAAIESAVDGVDLVIHLASETGTGQSMYAVHRCVDVNVSGTAMLLEALVPHAARVRKLVIASSRAVYGEGKYECGACGAVYPPARTADALAAGVWDPVCPRCAGPIEVRPTDEESRTAPASIYGASKLSQELLASAFGAGFGVPVAILRYQNVYGAGQSLSNPYTGILTHFYSAIRGRRAPRVFEDGHESRDFVHVSDVVRATTAALSHQRPAVFNVGTGIRTTIFELAEAMCQEAGAVVAPEVVGDYRVGDIRHCFADLTRIRGALDYHPQVTLRDGLGEFMSWAAIQPAERRQVEEANQELLAHGLLRSPHGR